MANDKITKITLYEKQLVDYLEIQNGIALTEKINSTYVSGYIPEWDTSTLLLANYNDDTINAGTLPILPSTVNAWSIYREKDGVIEKFIANVPFATREIIDYTGSNDNSYKYLLYPEDDDKVYSPIESTEVDTNWWSWILLSYDDTETENVYQIDSLWYFNLNISSDALIQNLTTTEYKTLSQFPKISKGQTNYYTGSLECLIGKMGQITTDGMYVYYGNDNAQLQSDFKDFVANGKEKILKDRKGNCFKIEIISNSFDIADDSVEQLNYIKFNFVEIGTTDEVSVINNYSD